jgi:hypothetical protein
MHRIRWGGLNKKCPEYPRKTIIEEDFIVAKEAKIKPQQQKDYEQVKDMLSRGEPGRNQHDLGENKDTHSK